jgi:hypothetical protein
MTWHASSLNVELVGRVYCSAMMRRELVLLAGANAITHTNTLSSLVVKFTDMRRRISMRSTLQNAKSITALYTAPRSESWSCNIVEVL